MVRVLDIGQECRDHPKERQEGTDSVHEFNTVLICKASQDGGADAADAEGEAKE